MEERYYPVALKIKNKTVLVIGGGKVAERKVFTLLKAQAKICIIAPILTARLIRLASSGKISWKKRKVSKKDICRAQLIIAATDNEFINKQISVWAKEKKILVNVADRPALSDFISTAILRKGKALISVYTNARAPALSRDLKVFLKRNWDEFISYRERLYKR